MFIELIDSLRCTNDHADSWLVASISRRDERFVTEGELGCPICLREYPIERGIVWFGQPEQQSGSSDVAGDIAAGANDPDEAVRVGAFLAVAEGAAVLLGGEWARAAHALSELVPLRIFVLNPSEPIQESESVGVVQSGKGIPLAPGMLRGVALDRATATSAVLNSTVAVLAPSGRLVAPADADIPDGINVLARDENFWVGEKRPALVSLIRR
ncbi:MAG: hypothetical protein ACR2GG_03060 [Gemmatimonadaceae bacterium]